MKKSKKSDFFLLSISIWRNFIFFLFFLYVLFIIDLDCEKCSFYSKKYGKMYTTLDKLEYANYKKKSENRFLSFFREIKTIVIIFFVVTVWMIVFTNFQVFFWSVANDNFSDQKVYNYNENNSYQDNQIAWILQENSDKIQEIEKIIDEEKKNSTELNYNSYNLESLLKNNIKQYDFKFNTLPPTDRLVVPSINIDVPLNLSQYKDSEDFTKWNFDEELKHWVVLYPTTPVPWNDWNTLIFGHTSLEFWNIEENPYGNVFVNIPKLEVWNEIKVIWKWKLYTYKVIEKVVKNPKQVNIEYLKYQDDNYVTLMGCYPIGTDKQRIMVIGKLIN